MRGSRNDYPLKLNTFFIEKCNFMKNTFPFFQDRLVKVGKILAVRAWVPRSIEFSLIKFNQLIANWLLVLKKRLNFFQDWVKGFCGKSPCHLISMFENRISSINEVKLSSKSFRNPIKTRSFSVVTLKLNFISWIRSIISNISLNSNTTFSVNETSKIRIIALRRCNSIFNFLKVLFYGNRNKIIRISEISNLNYKMIFFFLIRCLSKFFENNGLFVFFNKKFMNSFKFLKKFPLKNITMNGLSLSIFWCTATYCSPKYTLEPMQVFNMGRIYNNIASGSNTTFGANFPYKETSVPIEVTSSISKIGIFNHVNEYIWLGNLSHKVIVENPTNLGLSDFSLVATTLDSNNAQKFVSGIEGDDKFGTGPIRSGYFMLSSTELQSDFDALTGQGVFNQWNYPSQSNALLTEWGSVYNTRILTSSEAAVARNASANGQDVYYNTVVGRQAVTHISQDGESMKLIYRDPMYSGMLAQNFTLAVKFWQSQAITQDTAIRNLLCTSLYAGQLVQ